MKIFLLFLLSVLSSLISRLILPNFSFSSKTFWASFLLSYLTMALPVLPNQCQVAMSIASITTPSFSKIRMTCFLRKLFGKQNFCNFNAFTMQVLFRSVHVSSIGMIFSFKFLWLMKRVVRSFFCNHNFTLKNFIFFFKIVDFFFNLLWPAWKKITKLV